MADKIEDGGPAFPFIAWQSPSGMVGMERTNGMTMRDYFAGQAIMGFMASTSRPTTFSGDDAKWAYTIADAMIAARKGEL
jgi:hypothetical protein